MSSSHVPTVIPRVAERILAIEAEGQGAAILGVAHSWVEVPDVGWLLTVPLIGSGRVLGALVSVRERAIDADEADELTRRLDLLADVLAGALTRKEVEDALRGREGMTSAILSSLPAGVAVLDRHGTIVTVNEGWTVWAHPDAEGIPREGENYLEGWRQLADTGIEVARAISEGIEGVIDGVRPAFTCEFTGATPAGEVRWLVLSVVPLARPPRGGEGSVVVVIGPAPGSASAGDGQEAGA